MAKRIFKYISPVAVSLALALPCAADPIAVRGTWSSVASRSLPLYISLKSTEGLENFVFRPRSSDSPTPDAHYQGTIRPRGAHSGLRRAALSISGNHAWLFYTTRRRSRLATAYIALSQRFGVISAQVVHSARANTSERNCGADFASSIAAGGNTAAASIGEIAPPLTIRAEGVDTSGYAPFVPPRVVELATLADFDFVARYGTATQSYTRAVVNAAEGIYTKQLGIRLDIVNQKQLPRSSQAVVGIKAEDVLESFRKSSLQSGLLGNADIFHLFTGKQLRGATIGLSYVGSACVTDGVYNFGISQAVNSALQPLLLAHEIGHNLGASHDETPGSIMNPDLGTDDTRFLPQSLQEIHSFVTTSGSCLAQGDMNELTLKITRGSTFRAAVQISSAIPQTCTAYLYGSTSASAVSPTNVTGATLLAQQRIVTQGDYESSAISFEGAPTAQPTAGATYYFRAFLSCPAAISSSPAASIKIGKGSAAGIKRTANRWLAALAKTLVSSQR